MRLLRVTTLYPDYVRSFYAARPGLEREPYDLQRERLNGDFFGWADSWSAALAPLGWESFDVLLNVAPLQRAWARERLAGGASRSPAAIAREQARAFRPDVIWYDHDDAALLAALREAAPGARGVAGWTGSAIGRTEAWGAIDLMLSCAPEAVERCRAQGLEADVLPHAFDPRVLDRLDAAAPAPRGAAPREAAFIGQLIDAEGFHGGRLQLLAEVAREVPLALFVPRPGGSWRSAVRRLVTGRPRRPVLPPELGSPCAGVYGVAMYRVLRDSRATLNIHADSSPRFASNMRLFEATGVGTCLVTDWKENIDTIFEPGREVVTYRDARECVEVLRRLLDRPEEARAIAEAGQKRTLAAHTFAHRAPLLDEHLRRLVGGERR